MVFGDVAGPEPVLVRVHSECLTGDVFGSQRCDCQAQLHKAMAMITEEGRGVIVYLRQEGRGIGLIDKLRAYALQDEGLDTVQANVRLGLPVDKRDYGTGAQILADLGVTKLRTLTNNPKKYYGLAGYGLEVVEQVPLMVPPTPHNERYLRAKRDKLGHLLSALDSDAGPPVGMIRSRERDRGQARRHRDAHRHRGRPLQRLRRPAPARGLGRRPRPPRRHRGRPLRDLGPGELRDPPRRPGARRPGPLRRDHLPRGGHPRRDPHFDFVAGEASRGVGGIGLRARIPTAFGIVTTETLEQAIDRAGGKHGNKGADAALAAVEMVSLLRTLRAEAPAATGRRRVGGSRRCASPRSCPAPPSCSSPSARAARWSG